MKRLLINAACLVLLTGLFSSCKKTLEDDYQNPEKITEGSLSKLFGGMFLNKRIHVSYWDYATFILPYTGGFSGLTPLSPEAGMYNPNTGYTDGRWVDFYNGSTDQDYNYNGPGILSNYREMEKTFAGMDTTSKTNGEIYMNLAKVVLYDQTSQMIDLWGDIPFYGANSLNTDGTIKPAAFDDAAALYDSMITNLARINTYLANVTLGASVQTELSRADLYYAGTVSNWRRYANSLRLRLLMRISNVNTSAQAQVVTMLNNPTDYPLISSNEQNALLNESPTNLRSDLALAFQGTGSNAPAFIVNDLMLNNDDPRLDIMFDSSYYKGWRGFQWDGSGNTFDSVGYLATYDSTLFYYNYNLPGVVFTAAEVSFLKAEAAERFGTGNAQTEYENGITQSVNFWASLAANTYAAPGKPGDLQGYTVPTTASIANFIAKPAIAYSGTTEEKLAKIYTQKWVSFSLPQAGQAWAEYRRTGYPALQFVTAPSAVYLNPPTRVLYPSSEQLYNAENYSKVAAKNTLTTKIFWAK